MVDDKTVGDKSSVNLVYRNMPSPVQYLEWEGELGLPEEEGWFTGHGHPLQLLAVHDGADEVGHLQTCHTVDIVLLSG